MHGWVQEIRSTIRGHVYMVRYAPWDWRLATQQLGRWAGDPEIDIDWRDVGALSAQVYANRDQAMGLAVKRDGGV